MKNFQWRVFLALFLILAGWATPASARDTDGYKDKWICRIPIPKDMRPHPSKMHGNTSWDAKTNAFAFNKAGKMPNASYDHFLHCQRAGTIPPKEKVPAGIDIVNLYVSYTGGDYVNIMQCVNNDRGTYTTPYGRETANYEGTDLSVGSCVNLFIWPRPKKVEPPAPTPAPAPPCGKLVLTKTVTPKDLSCGKVMPFPANFKWCVTVDVERQELSGSWTFVKTVEISQGSQPDKGSVEVDGQLQGFVYRGRERAVAGMVAEKDMDQVKLDSACAELRFCNVLPICPPAVVVVPPPPPPPAPVRVIRKRVFVRESEHPYELPRPTTEFRVVTRGSVFGGVSSGSRQKVFRNRRHRGNSNNQPNPPREPMDGGGKTPDTGGGGNNPDGDTPDGY
jgi:hypothetical protein